MPACTLCPTRRHGSPAADEDDDGGYRPLVAIVEDDEAIRQLLDEMLRDEGFRTLCCATARESHALLGPARPDLIILDLWLESRDAGWLVLEWLRHDTRLATVPVLICTADQASLEAHTVLSRNRACAVLAKPFDIDALLHSLGTLLPTRHRHADR